MTGQARPGRTRGFHSEHRDMAPSRRKQGPRWEVGWLVRGVGHSSNTNLIEI